jgi:hypothetical protein
MATEDISIQIFCLVDDRMKDMLKHSHAKAAPCELVTIGILFALKGRYFRACYCWPCCDHTTLIVGLAKRTRMPRFLRRLEDLYGRMLVDPPFLTAIDSYPIELLFPIREGPCLQQVGKQGEDKGLWTVDIKLHWLFNNQGQAADWYCTGLATHDQQFHPLIYRYDGITIVLSDLGFRCEDDVPANLKLRRKVIWSERMRMETALSMVTVGCDLKWLRHRLTTYDQVELA